MKTIVLVIRHPDHSDDIETFEGDEIGAEIIYVDLGSSFDSKPDDHDQWQEWGESILSEVANLPHDHRARLVVESLIEDLAQEDLTPELFIDWLGGLWTEDGQITTEQGNLIATMLRVYSDDPRSMFIELDERPGRVDPGYAEGDWHWKLRQARNDGSNSFFDLI